MTIDVGEHTTVVHGWGNDPMSAVSFALERVPNLVENGWSVLSVSHAYGPGLDIDAEPVNLYSAVVTLKRDRSPGGRD